jgi:hypothetical protein
MLVETDHQIIAVGRDEMRLIDESGDPIVIATRENGEWTVALAAGVTGAKSAKKLKAVKAVNQFAPGENEPPRRVIIQGMVDMALKACPNDGYSTLVPHGLEDML